MQRTFIVAALFAATLSATAHGQASGLTKVQIYALQQQLKNECGLAHATGVMDTPTLRAVAVCNKHYGTSDPASLLSAMNIGFSDNDTPPGLEVAARHASPRSRAAREMAASRARRHASRSADKRADRDVEEADVPVVHSDTSVYRDPRMDNRRAEHTRAHKAAKRHPPKHPSKAPADTLRD
jgi:hypothetical protein